MYMVLFVLHDPSHLDQILDSLSKVGVSGVTIIESSGLHRHQVKRVPMRYTFGSQSLMEEGNTTIFTIVPYETNVKACLDTIEQIVGDLSEPNTGIFCAWPLGITKGIPSPGED